MDFVDYVVGSSSIALGLLTFCGGVMAFIGGWFIWGWGLYENIIVTIMDVIVLCFGIILIVLGIKVLRGEL